MMKQKVTHIVERFAECALFIHDDQAKRPKLMKEAGIAVE
jgi:hypothetical protein